MGSAPKWVMKIIQALSGKLYVAEPSAGQLRRASVAVTFDDPSQMGSERAVLADLGLGPVVLAHSVLSAGSAFSSVRNSGGHFHNQFAVVALVFLCHDGQVGSRYFYSYLGTTLTIIQPLCARACLSLLG